MMPDSLIATSATSAIAALADVSRRTLYDYVRRQDHAVSREEAADAVRISRGLAAFHLDKLVDAGLLAARYEAPPGQPRGRGRAPKVYEPASDGLTVTIPERRYELIAEILADAVANDPTHADDAAQRHARARGAALGAGLAPGGGGVVDALAGLGFEPEARPDGRIVLHNCPFHALATRHTTLICGLNHAFITGLVKGLGATGVRTRLAPRPGACCVELTQR
jgi:predicted ArsR family transcriptional regulator